MLVATTQSKATLRAVAGDLASWEEDIAYFPSYELISTHPMRGAFFNPDMRSVSDAGVDFVMAHFFAPAPAPAAPPKPAAAAAKKDDGLDLLCDEGLLEQFAQYTESPR